MLKVKWILGQMFPTKFDFSFFSFIYDNKNLTQRK